MQFAKSKTMATLIATFLMLTIAFTLVALPVANAHDPPWTIRSFCYISVSPNPVGVNQDLAIVMWRDMPPPTAQGAYGDRWTFTVEVTKPDSSKETLGPFTSDPVGTTFTSYIPDQVGTYSFVSKFPETTLSGEPFAPPTVSQPGLEYVGDTFEASNSDPVYVTVQQEPIQSWTEAPLPTGYWTRPINNMNRGWYKLAGSWLAGSGVVNSENPYTEGPESAHIMWARPIWEGGVVGGQYGDEGYFTGQAYEGYWAPPIVMNGKLYYNVQTPPRYGYYCVDLLTGEEIWFHNSTGVRQYGRQSPLNPANNSGTYPELSFGQILYYESPNEHGGFPYLWITVGTTWQMYDAFTGNWICDIKNVPSGTRVTGEDGSLLIYQCGPQNKWLACWNSSQAMMAQPPYYTNEYWLWRPYLAETFDGRNGYSWNVTLSGVPSDASVLGIDVDSNVLLFSKGLAASIHVGLGEQSPTYTNVGVSLESETAGRILWTQQRTAPPGNITLRYGTAGKGIYLLNTKETRLWYAYSSTTGEELWSTTTPQAQWDMFGMGGAIAYDKVFSYGYGGVLYAYDAKTGNLVWNYSARTVGFEISYENYPLSLGCIADGKLYMYSTEHSPSMPLWRGSYLRCINASNGAELWKISHWGQNPVIADGYIVDLNLYDNRIYCYGKGPSATTVSAPQTVITQGQSVMITGTVTDQASGAKEIAQTFGYTNGVPAISDADQQGWMEYLYEQQAIPSNATGVEVSLDTLDPNGNFVHIGTATSDMSGMFKKMWTPEVPGEYTVIATFAGSNSYWPSYSETAVGVSEAPATTPPTETTIQESPMLTYLLVAAVVIIILAVVAIVLLLRRK